LESFDVFFGAVAGTEFGGFGKVDVDRRKGSFFEEKNPIFFKICSLQKTPPILKNQQQPPISKTRPIMFLTFILKFSKNITITGYVIHHLPCFTVLFASHGLIFPGIVNFDDMIGGDLSVYVGLGLG